jgi:hypothetical protein
VKFGSSNNSKQLLHLTKCELHKNNERNTKNRDRELSIKEEEGKGETKENGKRKYGGWKINKNKFKLIS